VAPGNGEFGGEDRNASESAAVSSLPADFMIIRVFGVVDVAIPLDGDLALRAVFAKFCEVSPMFTGVSLR
jgi:hypothetical protein